MAQQGRWAALTVGLLAALVLAGADTAQAKDCNTCPAFQKLGRGVSNVVLGMVEVPVTMIETGRAHGQVAGFFVGLLKGTCRAVVRMGAGVIDTVTFPLPVPQPDYQPLITPEFPPSLMDV